LKIQKPDLNESRHLVSYKSRARTTKPRPACQSGSLSGRQHTSRRRLAMTHRHGRNINANHGARIFKGTADDSPSPWGEGRVEGGCNLNYPPTCRIQSRMFMPIRSTSSTASWDTSILSSPVRLPVACAFDQQPATRHDGRISYIARALHRKNRG
jgi:hypothetical protein